MSELISNFYGWQQRKNESEDIFADDLQILVRKIIAHKPSFKAEATKQLKHQYAHKLHDQFYVAIACSALQTSNHMDSFTQFLGHITCDSHSKLGKISSWAAAVETASWMISEESWEPQSSKNSWQHQNKIDQQASRISSMKAQNKSPLSFLEPKFLVNTITQAVASSLNISGSNMLQNTSNGTGGYTGKPYMGKPRPPQLVLGIDDSLNPEHSCQYWKDTSHLKENCVKLNRRPALENRQPDKNSTDQLPKQWENSDFLWSQTKPEERRVVLTLDIRKILKKAWFIKLTMPPFWQRYKWKSCNEQLQNAPKCALGPMEFKFHLYWIPAVNWPCFGSCTSINICCQNDTSKGWEGQCSHLI